MRSSVKITTPPLTPLLALSRPFIDAKTQVKVQFGPPSCLVDFIDPKFLPKKYGGTLEGDIPVHPHGTRPHGLAHSHTT